MLHFRFYNLISERQISYFDIDVVDIIGGNYNSILQSARGRGRALVLERTERSKNLD